MTVAATIEFEGLDKDAVRRRLEALGFAVTRVTLKAAPAGNVTPMTPGLRAGALLDIPEGLDRQERDAYVRGYGKGATAYHKKSPMPSGNNAEGSGRDERGNRVWTDTDWTALRWRVREYEWERHPACHKAAMQELQRWRAHWAAHRAFVNARSQQEEIAA